MAYIALTNFKFHSTELENKEKKKKKDILDILEKIESIQNVMAESLGFLFSVIESIHIKSK